jgi:hypothetical protein
MIYEKCRDILLRECELVQNAAVIQENIRLSVIEHKWADFEDQIKAMNSIENQLVTLENEREQLFTAFEALTHYNGFSGTDDPKRRFYAMASILPENQRNELTAIYRSLRLEAMKLRIANEVLMTYLAQVNSTVKEFFDLAFPERAGKVYTSQGIHLSHDMRSMVVNHSF